MGPELGREQVQAISRALAEPRRFAMLQQIAGQESMLCGALEQGGAISPATMSHHLKELQQAGLLAMEREGRCMRLTFCRAVWEAYLRKLAAL